MAANNGSLLFRVALQVDFLGSRPDQHAVCGMAMDQCLTGDEIGVKHTFGLIINLSFFIETLLG